MRNYLGNCHSERSKQAEEKIKKSNEQLIGLNAEKDKFFSIISHDLKSPFSDLLGLTELMADSTEEFSQTEFIENSRSLNEAAQNLYKLLDNLLEWAQMQKGSINFAPKDFDLSKMVSQSINTINQRAMQKRITIINEVGNTQKVYADEKKIGTILRNLYRMQLSSQEQMGKLLLNQNDLITAQLKFRLSIMELEYPKKMLRDFSRSKRK